MNCELQKADSLQLNPKLYFLLSLYITFCRFFFLSTEPSFFLLKERFSLQLTYSHAAHRTFSAATHLRCIVASFITNNSQE